LAKRLAIDFNFYWLTSNHMINKMNQLYILLVAMLLCLPCKAQKLDVKTISDQAMKQFKTSGTTILKNIRFKDKNGLNYVIATMEEAAKDDYTAKTLWIEHFIEESTKKLKLVREIIDVEKDCPVDNQLSLIDDAFEVTDLDRNGYAEIIFMYKTGCKGDVSPSGLKLMVLQNGSKAAIRGRTVITGFNFPHEKQPDVAFKQLPKVIQQYANNLWNKFEKEYE